MICLEFIFNKKKMIYIYSDIYLLFIYLFNFKMELTYIEFIEKVGKKQFRKCLNNELTHYDFKYKIGLNEDYIPFNPLGSCKPGGLYFTTIEHIDKFFDYGLNIAIIELCEDAMFYIEPNGIKFKTNKFIIKKILPQTEELCETAIKQNVNTFKFVTTQTPKLCKMALRQNGYALQYVKKQTDVLCTIAVQQNGLALQYVKEQNEELCKLALEQNGLALYYVDEQNEELCRIALEQNPNALQFVN